MVATLYSVWRQDRSGGGEGGWWQPRFQSASMRQTAARSGRAALRRCYSTVQPDAGFLTAAPSSWVWHAVLYEGVAVRPRVAFPWPSASSFRANLGRGYNSTEVPRWPIGACPRADEDESGSVALSLVWSNSVLPHLTILRPSSSSLVCSLAAARVLDRRPQHGTAAAMVFEDESSDDQSSLPYMHSSSSTDGLNQVPFSIEDPDYKGLELDLMVFCEKHGKASERLVAFEGTDTGMRFLACAEPEGHNCGFVE